MRIRSGGPGLLLLAGVAVLTASGQAPPEKPPKATDVDPLKAKDVEKTAANASVDDNGIYENGRMTSFPSPERVWGAVAKVGKDSIELFTEKGKPAVVYPAHVYLVRGQAHLHARTSQGRGYRLQDVEVGDVVEIGIHKEHETTYCVEIRIRKRPGGKVPPDPSDPTYGKHQLFSWHEWQNCLHDFLDRDIPLPDKWRDVMVDKDGKGVVLRGPDADEPLRKKHAHQKGLPDYHPDFGKADPKKDGKK